jgi:hypothetical protein
VQQDHKVLFFKMSIVEIPHRSMVALTPLIAEDPDGS